MNHCDSPLPDDLAGVKQEEEEDPLNISIDVGEGNEVKDLLYIHENFSERINFLIDIL